MFKFLDKTGLAYLWKNIKIRLLGFVHSAEGVSGTNGYVKVCQITINKSYVNQPLEFKITRRGDNIPTTVYIQFYAVATTTPTLQTFKYSGYADQIFIMQSSDSIWDLYVKKTEGYDKVYLTEVHNPYYETDAITVIFTNEIVTTLPDGYIQVSLANIKASVTSASKLTTVRRIGKAFFDGSANLEVSSIMGRGGTLSTGTTNKNKYSKIATVTFTAAWAQCSGILSIIENEGGSCFGNLYFSIKEGATLGTTSAFKMYWLSLNDSKYEELVVVESAGNGVYNFYLHPTESYRDYVVTLIDGFNPSLVTFYGNASYVDTVEATYTSSLMNVAQKAIQDGNGNVIADTYAKILDAGNGSYETGRVWLDKSAVERIDFCVMVKKSSDVYSDRKLYFSDIDSSLSDACVIGAQVFGSYGESAVPYVGSLDHIEVSCNNSYISFEGIPSSASSAEDSIMLYGYVEFVDINTISVDDVTKTFE